MGRLQKAGITVNTIVLRPLNTEQMTRFIADTLRADPQQCTPLAELLLQKTQGNPFALTQMLYALYENQMFVFNKQRSGWDWDLEQIRLMQISEEDIFEIVRHFNLGQELITSQAEKNRLSELNLFAGKKAKASAAYDAACKFLKTGITFLSGDSWQQCYKLTLNFFVDKS